MNVPCYGCENRMVGCHAECEHYKEYRLILKAQAEEKSKRNHLESDLCAVKESAVRIRKKIIRRR